MKAALMKVLLAVVAVGVLLVMLSHVEAASVSDAELGTADAAVRMETVGSVTDDDVARRESVSVHYTQEEEETMRKSATQHQFDAEVGKLMRIIINSLYSNKEIFLRELISNASDALDKIRLLGLTDANALNSNNRMEIRVSFDSKEKTITIRDTGVGMTRKELEENLGTIARSGTEAFVKSMGAGGSEGLIGQFGVGFYSAFLVADRVSVTSKHNDDDKQWIWESSGSSDFTITEDPRGASLGRGTRIVLHLKEDDEEVSHFLNQDRLREIIERYSEFIGFKIYLRTSTMEEVPASKATAGFDDEGVEVHDEEADGSKPETITQTVWRWETVNDPRVPIWRRAKSENSRADYVKFYESLTRDDQEPLAHEHFKAEGDVEFNAILYVPEDNQKDRSDEMRRGPRLYVRRVFITDNWRFLIPRYLEFLKGVVDSDDLPLNVSREMLQQHATLEAIKKKVVRKAIQMFQDLANAAEKSAEGKDRWQRFWKRYGGAIKLGVIEDMSNRSRLARLTRFHTSTSPDELTGLDNVVERMKEGQKNLFYLAGESASQVRNSPLLEAFKRRGVEVLFALSPIDEYMFLNLGRYDHKFQLVNIGVENFDVDAMLKDVRPLDNYRGDDDNDGDDLDGAHGDDGGGEGNGAAENVAPEIDAADVEGLLNFFQSTLDGKISRAKESKLLTSSPCALVSGMFGMSANMRRVMKAQAAAKGKRQADMAPEVDMETKVMEVNLNHPLVRRVHALSVARPESAKKLVSMLYDTAAISSGFGLDDEKKFVRAVYDLLNKQQN